MKPARETIQWPAPPSGIKVARSGPREVIHAQDLQASYERGRLDGERLLSEQLVQQRAQVMELQTGVLASLQAAIPQVIRDGERALVSLAVEAAHKLVAGLPISTDMLEAAVREACARVEDGVEFTVQLHPADLALLQQTNSPLLLPQGGHERILFQSSANVSRGGCVVQTRFGIIDARRETKLELLHQALAP